MISSTNGRKKRAKLNYISRNKQIKPHEKTKKRTKYNFKIPVIVLSLLFIYLAVSLGGEMQKLNAMKNNVQEIEQEIDQIKARNDELHKMLKAMESNEYVEQIAREKLGLVKPGESPVVPADQASSNGEVNKLDVRDPDIEG